MNILVELGLGVYLGYINFWIRLEGILFILFREGRVLGVWVEFV